MDMMAAGTSAPIATAAKATPANQCGNSWSNSCGTTVLPSALPFVVIGLTFAAIAM